ncbi:MAG: hypothetical protein QOG35_2634 [Solirubrobacteraceae bacterium]|jgi:uncharacterized protein YkwD|nr:hypothetical protein [Solirubrobacteraceae bacterium]
MRLRSRHSLVAALCLALVPVASVGHADADAAAGAAARAKAASDRCADADSVPGLVADATARRATLCLMNAERTARGRKELRDQPALTKVARRYADQMVRGRFFAHTSPGGSTMLARIRETSYLENVLAWSVGENLAWGTGPLATPRATVRAWMLSPGHRRNLLDPSFADVGIGIVAGVPDATAAGDAGGTYVTDFGRRVLP